MSGRTVSPRPCTQRERFLALLVLALFIAAYLPVFRILVEKWSSSDEYSYAFLTLPVIGYMIWQKRHELRRLEARASWLGLLALLCAAPLYGFALLTKVNTLISLSMFTTLTGALVYIYGIGVIRVLFTPLLLVLLLIPIPDQLYIRLTSPLQLKVSQFSEILIRSLGVTIFREGNIMTIPGKSFEVVEACSGLRSLITLMTLSTIIGHFLLQRGLSRCLLFLASVPTAIVVNIFRITAMILLYHYFKIDLIEGAYHTIAGVLVFLLALAILLLLQRMLEWWETGGR